MADFDLNAAIPSYGMAPEYVEGDKPFKVLGVALVVDQKGKEAKMVFRYPTMMPWENTTAREATDGEDDDSDAVTDDLFFRLPPRQIAKLFRPKSTLCGQAMTLSVGGTVFCCRAVIIKDSSPECSAGGGAAPDDRNSNDSNNVIEASGKVELFSLIVALVPRVSQGSPIPITGLVEERKDVTTTTSSTKQQGIHNKDASTEPTASKTKTTDSITITKETQSFLCVRRVHVSLTRICRVLEREERRCRYVTLQTDFYSHIRKQASPVGTPSTIMGNSASTTVRTRRTNSFSSIFDRDNSSAMESSSGAHQNHHRKRSVRGTSAPLAPKNALTQWEEAEREQEILETVMAAAPPRPLDNGGIEHQGNMAREIVQFYHALARNDNDFPPTPSLLLTGRDGIVHVNQHIAVAIEAVTPSRIISQETRPLVRPYHTLLFPKSSQKALLESLSTSGSTAPRRLQQLLLSVSPQKSLTEISVDANLSQQTTMEIATYLVGQGACVTSFVVSRNSRLACKSVAMIHKVSLAFSQTFGVDVSLFVLVGFLTGSGWKLGEAISAMTCQVSDSPMEPQQQQQQQDQQQHQSASSSSVAAVPPEVVRLLRAQLVAALPPSARVLSHHTKSVTATASDTAGQQGDCFDPRLEQLEDVLFQMAVWLCAHRVLVHLQDYLVVATCLTPPVVSGIGTNNDSAGAGGGVDRLFDMTSQQQPQQYTAAMISTSMISISSIMSAPMSMNNNNNNNSLMRQQHNNVESTSSGTLLQSDEILFRELQEMDCLAGNVSIPACCWRLGIADSGRLRAFAHRHASVRIITRVAEPTDDWAAA